MTIGTTDDKFDIHTHKTSKFLFYYFNKLRRDFGKEAYQIRHTIILDDLHAIEKLQSKNWPYCFRARIGHISLIVYWKILMVAFHHSV